MDAQRSLAAIVFTDVVGYSALMAADEARAVDLFQRDLGTMREICARNDGQVLKTMGDGVLMVFGSAVQAVSSALEMQAAFTAPGLPAKDRLVHRIGIHVGDVLLSESDAHGDGVNVAARLHEAAPPGGIWVSSTVYDIVKGRLPVAGISRGNHEFKNIPVPVMVFEITQGTGAARPAPKRPGRSSNVALTVALVVLAVAIVSAGGLIYSASLHPQETITEMFDPKGVAPTPSRSGGSPASQPASRANVGAGSASPEIRTKVAVISKPSESPPAQTAAPPQGTAGLEPDKSSAVRSAKPQSPVTPTNTGQTGQAAPGTPPPKNPAAAASTSPSAEEADADTGVGSSQATKPDDPVADKKHYLFRKYLVYLKTLPDVGTPASKQSIYRWHQMVLMKDQAIDYLVTHTKSSPLMIHMSGPTGVADYGVTVNPPAANAMQATISIQSPGGQAMTFPFGRLTPPEVDALFQAAAQGLLQDPSSAGMKSVFGRRLNIFEDEYGLPRSQL